MLLQNIISVPVATGQSILVCKLLKIIMIIHVHIVGSMTRLGDV